MDVHSVRVYVPHTESASLLRLLSVNFDSCSLSVKGQSSIQHHTKLNWIWFIFQLLPIWNYTRFTGNRRVEQMDYAGLCFGCACLHYSISLAS